MTVHLFHSTSLKNASVGYSVWDSALPSNSFFLSVFKNSCVTDTPPLPLLLWPLILKSSWIPSREGKYSLHCPPELYVLLTLEQSLATKNRLPTPNFVDSSCATTVFWHSVLLSGSHELSLPLPRVTEAQHVTKVLCRNCNDQMILKTGTWRSFFICRTTEKKTTQNYRIVETRNGKLIKINSIFFFFLPSIEYLTFYIFFSKGFADFWFCFCEFVLFWTPFKLLWKQG